MSGTYGKLHDANTMFFRAHVGTASSEIDGATFNFELSTNMGGSSPIIRCEETGKSFSLGWEDILNMAVEAGITREGKESEQPQPNGENHDQG